MSFLKEGERIVLQTVHGSHLYNLAHAESDYDSYAIFVSPDPRRKTYAKQNIDKENNDVTVLNLDNFVQQVNKGVPQALEALYSPVAQRDAEYEPYLNALRPSEGAVWDRYRRTILNFGLHHGGRSKARRSRDTDADKYKLARHALRLTVNLNDFMLYGSFNPRLSDRQASYLSTLATAHSTPAFETTLRTMLAEAYSGSLYQH